MKDAVPGEAYETGSLEMAKGGSARHAGQIQSRAGPAGLQPVRIGQVHSEGFGLVFNMHYTSIGKAATDRSRVVWFSRREPPKLRYFMHNGPTAFESRDSRRRDGNAEVVSEMTAQVDTQLVYLQPHMHLRGKDYELRLVFPNGEDRDGLQSEVGLQLADGLRPRPAHSAAERNAHHRRRALRQFGEQQVQSGSEASWSSGAIRTGTRCRIASWAFSSIRRSIPRASSNRRDQVCCRGATPAQLSRA